MNRLLLALPFLLLGCHSDHEHGHGHDSGHDHNHSHADAVAHSHKETQHEAAGHDHAQDHGNKTATRDEHHHTHEKGTVPQPTGAILPQPGPFPVGGFEAVLQATDDRIRLKIKNQQGEPVPAAGTARMVLSGKGIEEQRLSLTAQSGSWSGPAKLTGGTSFLAVISVNIDGQTESGKVSWGDLPSSQPSKAKPEHEHGHDHGHKHGDGHGHSHEDGHGHNHQNKSGHSHN